VITNRKKVLVPDTLGESGWVLLRPRGDIEAVTYPPSIAPGPFRELLPEVEGVVLSLTPFREPEIAAAPQLRVVCRIGVGYDTVEVPALTRRRIPLMTTGTANSISVAEHALYFILTLGKRGPVQDALAHTGRWGERYASMPSELAGKTVLVIGFGRIGTRSAARCRAFEMTVLVYDPYVPPATIRAAGCEPVADLDAALPRADFVTVHCPKNTETTGLLNAPQLARMKRTAYVVNTARGGIVDEAALLAALNAGKLAGAGLDVFVQEPLPTDSPLLKSDKIITAPHMAGVTHESVDKMMATTIANLLSVLDGAPKRENVVNPEVLG
jgi:D-3-phosphoglycerate dehydrogenase / 2-oxoglutarate reductase